MNCAYTHKMHNEYKSVTKGGLGTRVAVHYAN